MHYKFLQDKEHAERNAKEAMTRVESLNVELKTQKQLSCSAMDQAMRARKESAAVVRAIQSLGLKVNISNHDDDAVNEGETAPKFEVAPKGDTDKLMQCDKAADFSVSVTITADESYQRPLAEVCESLCPFHSQDGGCRWPNAGCAQLGSQFVGLKANFDAFDRLSIHDSYFQNE